MQIEMLPLHALRPYSRSARTHSKGQVKQVAASMKRFGFTNPILVSDAALRSLAPQIDLKTPSPCVAPTYPKVEPTDPKGSMTPLCNGFTVPLHASVQRI
jgi:hypothetical protein